MRPPSPVRPVGEAARAQVGEDKASDPGLAGRPPRFGGCGVAEEVGLLRVVVGAVGLVDEKVRAPGVFDDVLAGTGIGGVDEGGATLRDTQADALDVLSTPKGVTSASPALVGWSGVISFHRRRLPIQSSTPGMVRASSPWRARRVSGGACTVSAASGSAVRATSRGARPPAWSKWRWLTKRCRMPSSAMLAPCC